MAEAFLRREVEARPELADLEVASAGVIAIPGNPATPETVAVMREDHGLDLSGHRARALEGEAADLVLTLDTWVTERARRLGVIGRIELLGEYAGRTGEEVADPYLGPRDDYRGTAAHIERLVRAAADRLAREMQEVRDGRA